MELYTFSDFEKIATTFTVRDIIKTSNLNVVKEDDTIGDLGDLVGYTPSERNLIQDSDDLYVCIVKDKDDKIIGQFSHKAGNFDKILADDMPMWGEVMVPISPSEIVSGDLPVIDLLSLFRDINDYFLVLEKNDITGVVFFYNLDCNEVRLSFFSLILELENLANLIIEREEIKFDKKTLKTYKRSDSEQFRDIVKYIKFEEKLKLLNQEILKSEVFEDERELNNFVELLKKVRNKIAHGDTIIGGTWFGEVPVGESSKGRFVKIPTSTYYILNTPSRMNQFLFTLRKLINSFNSYTI